MDYKFCYADSQDKMKKGDPVLKKATFKKKLSNPWTGPYLVVKPLSDALYVLTDKKKTFVAHADQLKPCPVEGLPSWAVKMRRAMNVR